uniref:Endonuclease/exonuclease/phosphatase domain-containing protein n=1 Tax=Cannabis sativa TaxID=3483 RepID=A0A803NUT8_CANSA
MSIREGLLDGINEVLGNSDLVVQKRPNFVFLCETLSRKDVVEKLRLSLGFDGAFSADVQGRSGGVAMLWRYDEEFQLLGYGTNYIDVSIVSREIEKWRLTGLYGEPNRAFRKRTWDLIRGLKHTYDLPWCIVGDLNNVTSQQDKCGGNLYPNWLIDGFCGVLDECGLHDLDLSGYPYTWERGRSTDAWIEVVEDTWTQSVGSPIMEKIKYCGEVLLEWGKDYSGKFKEKIKECKAEIRNWKKGRDTVAVSNYKAAQVNLNNVLLQREIFWKQRSKKLWLREGDQNSKFFHAKATSRRCNNAIQKLKNDVGNWVGWEDELQNVFTEYFNHLFTTEVVDHRVVIDCIQPEITEEQNAQCLVMLQLRR